MGREASCRCKWGSEETEVKVLLESHELLFRGGLKRKVPFSEIEDLAVKGECLSFRVGKEQVSLDLGAKVAARWITAMTEPPSLAKKLGITAQAQIGSIGVINDENLRTALSQGVSTKVEEADLLFAVVRNPSQLQDALENCKSAISEGAPIWIIYPKGRGRDLTEAQVRTTLIAQGLVDTKVASVSDELTALRFSVRREKKASANAS